MTNSIGLDSGEPERKKTKQNREREGEKEEIICFIRWNCIRTWMEGGRKVKEGGGGEEGQREGGGG